MPLNQVNRFSQYSVFGDQLGVLVWHGILDSIVGVELTNQERAEDFHFRHAPTLAALLTASATVRGAGTRTITGVPTIESFSVGNAVVGTVAGEAMPRQTAGVATLRSPFAGRSRRGRKYIPFPGESDNPDGIGPSAAYLARMNTYLANIVPAFVLQVGGNVETWAPLIVSKVGAMTQTRVTSFLARLGWGTQRRRGTFGRPNVSPV